MSITNSADSGRTISGGMSPTVTKVTLENETRVLGVTRDREITMGTDVVWAILTVVTQTMTLKALGERGGRTPRDRDLEDASGSKKDFRTIFQLYHEGPVKGKNSFVKAKLEFYCGRRG